MMNESDLTCKSESYAHAGTGVGLRYRPRANPWKIVGFFGLISVNLK